MLKKRWFLSCIAIFLLLLATGIRRLGSNRSPVPIVFAVHFTVGDRIDARCYVRDSSVRCVLP